MKTGKKFTALGADIFAGLFTQGVKQAGFEVLGHLEHGPYGVATAKANFPDLDIRVGRENWNESEFKGKVDFLYTNPPCAAWSNAAQRGKARGSWDTQLDRLRCVHDCVDAGLAIRPKAWCWESVTNAWRAGNQFVIHQAEKWNDAGYHCTVLLQDNQFLGTPQARQRMFLIAHKHPLVWPKLTKTTTVAEAFERLKGKKLPELGLYEPPLQDLFERLWKLSDNHNGYLRHAWSEEGTGGKKGRIPSVMVRRIKLDEPAPVMTDSGHRLHPTKPRWVSWHEWLALCGLPLTWKTSRTSLSGATVELARAVMPPVGKWLATAVRDGLLLPPLRGQPTTRLVDLRKPDAPYEEKLFTFDGFTAKAITPPPLPLLKQSKHGGGEPKKSSGSSRPGSGARIRELLTKGWSHEKILATIHQEFPGSKATKSDVSWQKNHMKREEKK